MTHADGKLHGSSVLTDKPMSVSAFVGYEVISSYSSVQFFSAFHRGWSGGAKVLGKLSVPGRPTSLNDSRARAYCTCSRCGWGFVWTFFLSSIFFSFLSPSLWETARYRLKYCLKGPLNPNQPKSAFHRSPSTGKHRTTPVLHQDYGIVRSLPIGPQLGGTDQNGPNFRIGPIYPNGKKWA